MMKSILLVVAFAPILFDWGFVIEGEIRLSNGSSDDHVYAFAPAVQVTKKDRLIQTGAGGDDKDKAEEPSQGTGVLRPGIIPPKIPPLSNITVSTSMMLPQVSASALAVDLPAHLAAGQQPPMISPASLTRFVMEKVAWLYTAYKPDDPIADKMTYGGASSSFAKIEIFYKAFLRHLVKYFGNNRTIEREDQFYLTLLGDPAGAAVAKMVKWTDKGFSEKYIDPETNSPEFPAGADEFETMMNKIVINEFVNYYPFTITYNFAPGLEYFAAEDIYPYVKKLLTNANKRVRRNAVYYLGTMMKYEPLTDLFEILKASTDNVMKARALYFLTLSNYPGIVDFLIEKLGTEKDPIFLVAYVNSLRRIADTKAFAPLVNRLPSMADDFELTYALIKACMSCADIKDKDSLNKFSAYCKRLYDTDKSVSMLTDPTSEFGVVDLGITELPGGADVRSATLKGEGAESSVRVRLLKQLIESASAIFNFPIGAGQSAQMDMAANLTRIGQVMEDMQQFNRNSTEMAFAKWETLLRPFLSEILSRFSVKKKQVGKWFLERLILSAYEQPHVLNTAINMYLRDFPDDFEKLAIQALSRDLPFHVHERVIKALYLGGKYSDKTDRVLKSFISKYRPDLSPDKKQLIALAMYYLGQDGKVKDSQLMSIIDQEVGSIRDPNQPKLDRMPDFLNIRLDADNYLPRIAIEVLGYTKTEKAKKYILKLSRNGNAGVRRLAAKALGNFKVSDVGERLVEMLKDEDGWVRLVAYMNLFRGTGIEQRTDWFFKDVKELAPLVAAYSEKVGAKILPDKNGKR